MTTLETVEAIEGGLPSLRDEIRRRWPIVLAGGQGRRMVDWIESRQGDPRPKQFCAFTGSRTMLQHTLDRAVQLAPPHNIVTVIGNGQRKFLPNGGGPEVPGRVIEQPADRGTAAGVLLPATYVRERDPDATLLILPSDHFIYPDFRFRQHAAHACRLAERFSDRFVLLGATATGAETDYGWIVPDRGQISPVLPGPGYQVWPVARFREKPSPARAATLFHEGGLWNTLVVAVKVKTLWAAGKRLLPGTIDRFEFLRRVLGAVRTGGTDPRREAEVLRDIYLDMPAADFSRDLLQQVASSSLVQPMYDVEWSDWGRPERVQETVQRLVEARRRSGRVLPSADVGPLPAWPQTAAGAPGGLAAGGELP